MSTNWNHGYYASEGYEYGYHVRNSPAYIQWACTMQGVRAPKSHFTYLDLGCGQGLNLIMHAVAHPESKFIGIDFMPTHIAHARNLAEKLELTNITFIEGDFLDLAKNPQGIAEVDYAMAHGISAWVSREVRQAMWELVGKVLKPGGIVYNSYNAYPFWFTMAPFQHLVMELGGDIAGEQAIKTALSKMQLIKEAGSPIFSTLPALESRLDNLIKQDTAYLVQEYNNGHWEPKYVAHMIEEVKGYKLDYIGTANFMQFLKNSYTPQMYSLIEAESSIKQRETIRDFLIGQAFRLDLYSKGPQALWDAEKMKVIGEQKFIRLSRATLPDEKPFETSTGTQRVSFPRQFFQEVLEEFGHEGKTVAEVQETLSQYTLVEVAEMATYLCIDEWLGLCGDNNKIQSEKVNKKISNLHLTGAPYQYVAHPKAQQAIRLNKAQITLLALHLNGTNHQELPRALHQTMLMLKRSFCIEGKEVTDENEFAEQAKKHADEFIEFILPKLSKSQ